MGEWRKRCRTYHENMLQPWNEKGETSLWVEEEKENEVEESEIVTWDKEIAVGCTNSGGRSEWAAEGATGRFVR